ncbi:hypothetical protein PP178_10635 [Zeaxanthinibacter sp. PT1]|uniref:hypothetical protein n=1 Tax=Zeaxanthinibacter TaxID=561554 RepID=UPI00234B0083|nr:hypothetical protein [Zeaxanthinibacter sp. PT1]MDC6352011.1 hypothetical protein [Zeaxanthinibacter sp. PT1]
MNSRKIIFSGLIVILSILCMRFLTPKEEVVRVEQASYGNIKCTVANFLLSGVDTTRQIAPLFENLGDHHFPISTNSERAQVFFDQGLRLTYGFNHAEAHRSFMEAARLDPEAAMAYWGQAYALGPNINDPLPDETRKLEAFKAIKKAKELYENNSEIEKDLINALDQRFSENLTQSVAELNDNYFRAMREVAKKHSGSAEIQTLLAAAAMDTNPWNYWDKNGQPNAHMAEAKNSLEKAIALNPAHPGAHHYYIHLMELPSPDMAEDSADILGGLMPAAGHMVHMPSHIYIRVGRYADAVAANQKAIEADEDYISQCYSQGLYPLAYYPHNIHFLWSAASLIGASEIAIDAARKTAEKVPQGQLAALPFLQDFAATPLLAHVRFGKWNQILTYPAPDPSIKHLGLVRHYARGMAFIRKNNAAEAEQELDAIESMLQDAELDTLVAVAHNSSRKIAEVAFEVISGELAALEGEYSKAVEHLRKAVALEEQLTYTEPSAWHIPPRQNLGALLLNMEKFREAEVVYREDLEKVRQNGWSLRGLERSLRLQGKQAEADLIQKEFEKKWAEADLKINSSVF